MNQLHFADIEQRHIGRAIAMQAQAIGERPFLLADARRFSFIEVNRRVNELAAGLAAGTVVVVRPDERLHEGARIRPLP